MFAVAYGRRSFDDPDERTSSVDDQQLFAQSYAERCELEVIAFYGDDGITGATMERPGLQQVLELITKGQVRNFIIEIAYTTTRGLRGKATRGGATGGRVLGYRREITGEDAQGRELDQLAISDEQAEFVRRIFRLYADGWSLNRICNALNADGIPSPRARERGKYRRTLGQRTQRAPRLLASPAPQPGGGMDHPQRTATSDHRPTAVGAGQSASSRITQRTRREVQADRQSAGRHEAHNSYALRVGDLRCLRRTVPSNRRRAVAMQGSPHVNMPTSSTTLRATETPLAR